MAQTTFGVDARRTDLRESVFSTPYWITSDTIDIVRAGTSGKVLLFTFETDGQHIIIHDLMVQVVEVAGGSTSGAGCYIGIGYCQVGVNNFGPATTTYSVISGCTSSGELFLSVDGAILVSGALQSGGICYGRRNSPGTASAVTDNSMISGTTFIIGDNTNPPCVYMTLKNGASVLTSGVLRVHVLVSVLPNTLPRTASGA